MLTKTARRIIFYALIIVFLVVGTGIVFYAQGYRLDSQSFIIRKIGAIYIRTFPADAQVFLDDKPVNRPFSIFDSGVLISNLSPKTYLLTATREGFNVWKKHVPIEPSMVAEFKHAVLVPNIPQKVTVNAESTKDFWLINDEVLRKNGKDELMWREKKLPGSETIGWTKDGLAIFTRDPKTSVVFRIDTQTGSSTPLASALRLMNVDPLSVTVDPEDGTHLISKTNHSLALVPLTGTRVTLIATSTAQKSFANPLAISSSRIAWTEFDKAENVSELIIFNKTIGTLQKTTKYVTGKTMALLWNADNLLGILQEDGGFFLYNPASNDLAPRASDVKTFAFSDDGSMLVTRESQSVEIFSLKNQDYWRLNLPEVNSIKNILWYKDNTNLIAEYPNKSTFISLEDRSLENIQTITVSPKNIYDPQNNQLYFIAGTSLYRLNFPD